jgi:hypothetical protein
VCLSHTKLPLLSHRQLRSWVLRQRKENSADLEASNPCIIGCQVALPTMGLAETSGPSGRSKSASQLFRSETTLLHSVNVANQITLVAKDVCAYVPLLPGLPHKGEGKEKQVSKTDQLFAVLDQVHSQSHLHLHCCSAGPF